MICTPHQMLFQHQIKKHKMSFEGGGDRGMCGGEEHTVFWRRNLKVRNGLKDLGYGSAIRGPPSCIMRPAATFAKTVCVCVCVCVYIYIFIYLFILYKSHNSLDG